MTWYEVGIWALILFPEDAMVVYILSAWLYEYVTKFHWKPTLYTKDGAYFLRRNSKLKWHPYEWLPMQQINKNIWREQGNYAACDDEKKYTEAKK